MKKIPYAVTDYKKLVYNNYYYVDKTKYIKELETSGNILMFLRPRRFGKTLLTSMLGYYYDVSEVNEYDKLFKGTDIYKDPTPYKNNYYILKFDFSGINTIADDEVVISKNFYIKVKNGLTNFINKYKFTFELVGEDAVSLFLDFLAKFEAQDLENKIYIIIDEYDNFTNTLLEGTSSVFKKVLGLGGIIRTFYEVIKEYTAKSIDRVFITGVCSISLDSMTSGFNIVADISRNKNLNSLVGFTHNEVKELIKNLPNNEEIYNFMEAYYDGYLFNKKSEEKVFNSTLVMYYINQYNISGERPDEYFDTNIIPSFKQIKNLMMLDNNKYYEQIRKELLENRTISGELQSNFTLEVGINRNDVISLLYYFGYITICGYEENSPLILKYKVPNKVINKIFNDYFSDILKEDNIDISLVPIQVITDELMKYGTIEKVTEYVSNILNQSSSRTLINFDEKYIQLIYFVLLSSSLFYSTYIEYPLSGGYADLVILSNSAKMKENILIELKYIKKKEYSNKKFRETREKAITQLKEYSMDRRINNLPIRKYVVIFQGSEVSLLEEV